MNAIAVCHLTAYSDYGFTVSYCNWVTVRLLILPEYGGGWNK